MKSRSTIRQAVCPACNAKPFTKCILAKGKPRVSNHAERWAAYRELERLKTTDPIQ